MNTPLSQIKSALTGAEAAYAARLRLAEQAVETAARAHKWYLAAGFVAGCVLTLALEHLL